MKIAKQYLSMIFVFAISLCVPLCGQEDSINKQQVYGQALYERTCSIIDESDSNSGAAENLVQTIMADQEIYVLLNIGKNEGFTVAELLGFAKTIAQENEDQEVVRILQGVEQEAAKNWFSKHSVITTMSALVIAVSSIFAYIQKDYIKQLFFDYLEKLGFGVKPTQTEAERLAAAQLAAEQEAAQLAAEQEAARIKALTRQTEQEDADFWSKAFKTQRDKEEEIARIAAEQEEAEKQLAVGHVELARFKAEQETLKVAEVERLMQFDRELNEASMTTEELAAILIEEERAQKEEEKKSNAEVISENGAETDLDSLIDVIPADASANPEVNLGDTKAESIADKQAKLSALVQKREKLQMLLAKKANQVITEEKSVVEINIDKGTDRKADDSVENNIGMVHQFILDTVENVQKLIAQPKVSDEEEIQREEFAAEREVIRLATSSEISEGNAEKSEIKHNVTPVEQSEEAEQISKESKEPDTNAGVNPVDVNADANLNATPEDQNGVNLGNANSEEESSKVDAQADAVDLAIGYLAQESSSEEISVEAEKQSENPEAITEEKKETVDETAFWL